MIKINHQFRIYIQMFGIAPATTYFLGKGNLLLCFAQPRTTKNRRSLVPYVENIYC